MDAARVLDVLALARAFVAAGHCKGVIARGIDGFPLVFGCEREAVSFCVYGGISRAEYELIGGPEYSPEGKAACRFLEQVCFERYGLDLDAFNDAPATTKRQVLALFDAAAARVGKG